MNEHTQEHTADISQEAHEGEHAGAHSHSVSYGSYIMVWLGLVALTAVTVTVAGIELGSLTLTTAMLIASVKTCFVGYYFMHIKFDNIVNKIFILVCLVIFLVLWILTFSDLSFR